MKSEEIQSGMTAGMPVGYANFRHNAAFMLGVGLGDLTSFASKIEVRSAEKASRSVNRESEMSLFAYSPFVIVHGSSIRGSCKLLDFIYRYEPTSKYIGSKSTFVESIFAGQSLLDATLTQHLSVLSFSDDIVVVVCLQPTVLDSASSVIEFLVDNGIVEKRAIAIHKALREDVSHWSADDRSYMLITSMLDGSSISMSEHEVDYRQIDMNDFVLLGSNT
ncbi:MAG: hypothetical protein NTX15_06680 [Candidatus Kapabacteria bacterium]|nr:hypothetical protein [Candidatus Kapabacteria bacterium]